MLTKNFNSLNKDYICPFKRSGQQEKPDYNFDAEYTGGHKAYTQKKDTHVLIFHDRIIL